MFKKVVFSMSSIALVGSFALGKESYAALETKVSNNSSIVTTNNVSTGWFSQNGNWYYKKQDGTLAVGWIFVNNKWYFMNPDGVMKTGWVYHNGKWYFMNSSGAMATGWVWSNGAWYYLTNSGAMLTGWLKENNTWYYLSASGAMQKGWADVNGARYYFNGSGKMLTSWVYLDNKWYFLNNSGAMQVGFADINGVRYYFDNTGKMQTGFVDIQGTKYYFASSGSMVKGWLYLNNQWYFLNNSGAMQVGFADINGARYYFDNTGKMQTGLVEFQGSKYYFTNSGSMVKGWSFINNQWYYFQHDGAMKTGWLLDKDKWYYLDNQGVMKTGWLTINGGTYYLGNNGAMLTGWQTIGGNTYYLNLNSGDMYKGQFLIDGKAYVFNDQGVYQPNAVVNGWISDGNNYYYIINNTMHKGWLKLDNSWYYLNQDGTRATGQQTINGSVYFFNANGVWTKGSIYSTFNVNSTLENALQLQMNTAWTKPQTDAYRNSPAYIPADTPMVQDPNNSTLWITSAAVDVREAKDANSWKYGSLSSNSQVKILGTDNGWHQIQFSAWRNAKPEDVRYFLNPNNFTKDTRDYLQFVDLSKYVNADVAELNNKILKGRGILDGKASTFSSASRKYNVNEVYLIAHCMLETGNGSSVLANGVDYNGKKVYNMFGIGAIDADPINQGAKRAYEEGWFTPEAAIEGGAKWISTNYINNANYKQNTLYKMKWNPAKPSVHQYATDIGWAVKQTSRMDQMYKMLDAYTLYYETPIYK